jgi:hypothetical protein
LPQSEVAGKRGLAESQKLELNEARKRPYDVSVLSDASFHVVVQVDEVFWSRSIKTV